MLLRARKENTAHRELRIFEEKLTVNLSLTLA